MPGVLGVLACRGALKSLHPLIASIQLYQGRSTRQDAEQAPPIRSSWLGPHGITEPVKQISLQCELCKSIGSGTAKCFHLKIQNRIRLRHDHFDEIAGIVQRPYSKWSQPESEVWLEPGQSGWPINWCKDSVQSPSCRLAGHRLERPVR